MSRYYLVDTNVLLAACGMATQLSPTQTDKVMAWVTQFKDNRDAFLLLDSDGAPTLTKSRIIEEYQRKMPRTTLGWGAVRAKLESGLYKCYRVAFEGTPPNEVALIAPTFGNTWIDPSDRKFVAVAMGHNQKYPRQRCYLVNATDTDWRNCASILRQHYVEVEELLR